jgi:hypothetical protein
MKKKASKGDTKSKTKAILHMIIKLVRFLRHPLFLVLELVTELELFTGLEEEEGVF